MPDYDELDPVAGAARAVEGCSYLPSLGLAYLDLALYLTAALGLGLWRSTRDT